MLERMNDFFDRRLDTYDWHQLNEIKDAKQFYPFTAAQLPTVPGCKVLDLGCGTGLELEEYFHRNPLAEVTGIDFAPGMLDALRKKFPEQKLTLICRSYFDVPLSEGIYDAAVSVESLHHFPGAQKRPLFRRVKQALRPGGYLILTDYYAESEEHERFYFAELARMKQEQGITDDAFYHYDTPLTVEHEIEALTEAGFRQVKILHRWGQTYTLRAE